MKKLILFTAFLLLHLSLSYAQSQCGVTAAQQQSAPTLASYTSSNTCFDAGDVLENCTQFYVAVNIHFFLDDNCQGTLAVAPVKAK